MVKAARLQVESAGLRSLNYGLELRGNQLATVQGRGARKLGRLTSVHLDIIAGRRACLSNEIEEAYGVTKQEAERQIRSFEARNQHPRPVSFR